MRSLRGAGPSRPVLLRGLAVVVVLALAGAAAGVLWEAIWTPPSGVAYQGRFVLDGEGLPRDFAGTGSYVVVAALVGLVLAAVVALARVTDELVTVVALLVGSALAAFLMWRVGTLLGPPDPAALARRAPDLQPLVADLVVHGRAAFLAFPAGAMLGALLVYVLDRRADQHPDERSGSTLVAPRHSPDEA